MIEQLKSKIISVANEFGLKDFIYDAFDLKTPLLIIQKQIEDQLEKHLGSTSLTVIGDGRNNSAVAAELYLGWVHETNTGITFR
ncbi:MAG: hypothetical protein J7604_11455 [Sporocytophaga sp.]|uniref:hypothetical protein n=1 Tax=Sporocytophaga sp. TaxID=2231183 RepID=UPI001B129880|nr:hypothetical protein [Sporocytophaga sp.]MBO9700817.1 hypothetical protein [Sporocytophaga sp.]